MKKNKPTPPAPQNRHRMVAFYLAHPEHPKSQKMLRRAVVDYTQKGGR